MLAAWYLMGGMITLVAGAEFLVRGATAMARLLRISPLVIGLTIVAYGTSTPELAVSVVATLRGSGDISLGNVVGSNICNVLLILGASALITPLIVHEKLIYFDVPLMVALTLGLFLVGYDGVIQRWEGILFCLGLVTYTTWLIVESRRRNSQPAPSPSPVANSDGVVPFDDTSPERAAATPSASKPLMLAWNVGLVLCGLALLILGSRWFVFGAESIARSFGLSDLVVGLTVVAIGTSLPELATSLMAALKGERDIAVGNVVGSNIFNILGVLGMAGVVAPHGMKVGPAALHFDIPVMLAVAVACLPIFFSGHRINRWEGGLFLGYYVAYVAYLVMASTEHDALPLFSGVMWWFVIPLTVVTLLVVMVHTVWSGNPKLHA
jgi:cation:H+ antiporter